MVAAVFPRALFDCGACAREKKQNPRSDPQAKCSGKKGSCEGPAPHKFLGGALVWSGCPRTSITPRIQTWLDWHARTDGKTGSVRELNRTPALLLEAFGLIEYALARRREMAQKTASAPESPPAPGRKR